MLGPLSFANVVVRKPHRTQFRRVGISRLYGADECTNWGQGTREENAPLTVRWNGHPTCTRRLSQQRPRFEKESPRILAQPAWEPRAFALSLRSFLYTHGPQAA